MRGFSGGSEIVRRHGSHGRGQPIAIAIAIAAALAFAAGCGAAPVVEAADVERCLSAELGDEGWSELPASEHGTVYGVDFGPNSALLYIEPDAEAVRDKISDIREAEDRVGNTGPGDRVILNDRGNVLVSWANEPSAEQRALIERCAGFS